MTEATTFDLPTASALARLRLFLDDARGRAGDLSEPGRHLALIALDGVVEYALWLVAQTIGAKTKKQRPDFGELQDAVRDVLQSAEQPWTGAGRAGVDQLRRARNDAQHAAVVPDDRQMAVWSDATQAYVDSLIHAAFGIGVGDLVLALAVRDRELRERLVSAERALDAGSADIAFSQSWISFELAVARWRAVRSGSPVPLPDRTASYLPGPEDPMLGRLANLESIADVQPFAPDMGEYVTLAAARAQQEHGWIPDAEDARRAMRFAIGWIVRWEAFERGYPVDRWAAWAEAIEPPIDASHDGPSIGYATAYLVRTETGNRRWSVHIQMTNLPERGRGDWGIDIAQCLVAAANDRSVALRPHRITPVGRSGRWTVELDPGADASEIGQLLRAAVEEAERRYQERRAEHAALEARRTELSVTWKRLVGIAEDVFRVEELEVETRPDGVHFVLRLELVGESDVYVDQLAAGEVLRSCGGIFAGAGSVDGRLEIDTTALEERDIEGAQQCVERAAIEVRRQRGERKEQQEHYLQFTKDLEGMLGSPPREN